MSKEIRESAERVIKYLGDSLSHGATVGDMHNVCRAYLAEHPADEKKLVIRRINWKGEVISHE